MILILAEKPSVAKTIASFLKANVRQDGYFEGNGYIVTYAVGHLVSLFDMKDYDKERYSGYWKMENYPFIPEDKFKFKVDKSKTKQFNTVKKLIKRKDIEYIINATDNDREGELIAFLILMQAKNKKMVKRILVNEWTPEDITRGLKSLKSEEEMRNLQAAGYTRLITDWLIGINFTCVATLKYGNGKMLNIGRVILPTVKLIYDRDMEIKNFVPKKYYEIIGNFIAQNGRYQGKLTKKDESRFDIYEDAKAIVEEIVSKKGKIAKKKVSKSKEFPQRLFSLTSLQGYITSKYSGFTSDRVLSICQSLYEGKGKGGFITYPRTDSTYLEESLANKVEKTLNQLKSGHEFENMINFSKSKRIFDSKKVESHSAIIPTYIVPSNLSRDENIVYSAIRDRFLMNFMPPAEFENTEIITEVDGYNFVSKGKVLLSKGYLNLENKESKISDLPQVSLDEIVDVDNIETQEKMTTPPKPYTEDTLLKAMKNCGKNVSEDDTTVLSGYSIGTSSTRAEVLKKIKEVGYVGKKGKNYYITDLGINLVEIFPVKTLLDVDFTGKLEKKLLDIQKGNYDRKIYLNDICRFIVENVNLIKQDKGQLINENKMVYNKKTGRFVEEDKMNTETSKNNRYRTNKNTGLDKNKNDRDISYIESKKKTNTKTSNKKIDGDTGLEIIASCPECGGSVLESEKAFACKNYRNCGFTVWKNDQLLTSLKKKPTKTFVKSLCKSKKGGLKSLIDSQGNKFEANFTYIIDQNRKLRLRIINR